MKEARAGCACAAIGDLIYVIGGLDIDDEALKSVEVLDTRSNSWINVLQMQTNHAGCAAVSIGKHLCVVGGSAIIEIYDSERNMWGSFHDETCLQTYSLPSISHINDKLYIFGGAYADDAIESNLRTYDLDWDYWDRYESSLKTWGHGCAKLTQDDVILFVGGEEGFSGNQDSPLASTMVYDVQNNSWHADMIPNMPKGRVGCAAVTVGDSLYVLGGHDGSSLLNSMHRCRLQGHIGKCRPAHAEKSLGLRSVADKGSTCVVCMERPRSHAFVPCGHLSICDICTPKISASSEFLVCPICRGPSSMLMKVYK